MAKELWELANRSQKSQENGHRIETKSTEYKVE